MWYAYFLHYFSLSWCCSCFMGNVNVALLFLLRKHRAIIAKKIRPFTMIVIAHILLSRWDDERYMVMLFEKQILDYENIFLEIKFINCCNWSCWTWNGSSKEACLSFDFLSILVRVNISQIFVTCCLNRHAFSSVSLISLGARILRPAIFVICFFHIGTVQWWCFNHDIPCLWISKKGKPRLGSMESWRRVCRLYITMLEIPDDNGFRRSVLLVHNNVRDAWWLWMIIHTKGSIVLPC